MFFKLGVLENFANFRKAPVLESICKKAFFYTTSLLVDSIGITFTTYSMKNTSWWLLLQLLTSDEHKLHINKTLNELLGDSRNYLPPIRVPLLNVSIAKQILVIAKLNGKNYFILRAFVCDVIRSSKELPVQS